MQRREQREEHERGSAVLGLSFALAMLLITSWLLVGVADRVVTRGRAQSAADAAALAGVAEGEARAATVAERNGATLVSFSGDANEVVVVVSIEGIRAVARAERRLVPPDG